MDDLVEFSVERKRCVMQLWRRDKTGIGRPKGGKSDAAVMTDTVIRWMSESDEIVNPETHFAVIMDPTAGTIVWLERYLEPLEEVDSD